MLTDAITKQAMSRAGGQTMPDVGAMRAAAIPLVAALASAGLLAGQCRFVVSGDEGTAHCSLNAPAGLLRGDGR